MKQLIDKRQLSEKLSISTRTLDRLISESGLPHFRIGSQYRFDPDAVIEWMSKRGTDELSDIL